MPGAAPTRGDQLVKRVVIRAPRTPNGGMKLLVYAGTPLRVGDDVAHALIDYACEVARAATADAVSFPAVTDAGAARVVTLVLTAGTSLLIEPSDDADAPEGSAAATCELRRRSAGVAPAAQPLEDPPPETGWIDEY
jgi:hypothetical protein